MSKIKMVVIQPENKTLIVDNVRSTPLDLSSANDVVRGNSSQPSVGDLFYFFTSSTEVSVNNSTPVSVTTDGSTYNTNVAGNGVDFVIESGRSKGDSFEVRVVAAPIGRDAHLDAKDPGIGDFNFGSCQDLGVLNDAASQIFRHKITLIYFDIPSVIKNILQVNDAVIMLYKDSTDGLTVRLLNVHAIMPANGDWPEGDKCNEEADGDCSWRQKIHSPTPGVSRNWASNLGGCQILGTDVESTILSEPEVGSSGSWLTFTSKDDNLNIFADRMVKRPSQNNHGFMIRTRTAQSTPAGAVFHSSQYTTDITLRPKMLILYEELDSGLDGGSPEYATSIGSEDTFGGS